MQRNHSVWSRGWPHGSLTLSLRVLKPMRCPFGVPLSPGLHTGDRSPGHLRAEGRGFLYPSSWVPWRGLKSELENAPSCGISSRLITSSKDLLSVKASILHHPAHCKIRSLGILPQSKNEIDLCHQNSATAFFRPSKEKLE